MTINEGSRRFMTQEAGNECEGWIQDLPKIPVPDLGKTLQRYLASLKPVIPNTQYEQTTRTVQEFLDGDGILLQQDLMDFAKSLDNWVTELWIEDMYLNNPIALLVNSNPFYMLPKQNFRSTLDHLKFAAKVVKFFQEFRTKIENETLSQDFGRGHGKGIPLCMQTYKHFFTSCRIPGESCDTLQIRSSSSDHFIVASRNQFFSVTLTPDEINDEETVIEALRCINQLSREGQTNVVHPIGLLTCENRRIWANLRSHLISTSQRNRASIEQIESSLYILCLDEFVSTKGNTTSGPGSGGCNQRRDSVQRVRMDTSYMANQLLTGGGSDFYTPNRWFDKMLQFVIGKDGICGLVCEHTASEGITVLRFLEEFLSKYPCKGEPMIGIQRQNSSDQGILGGKCAVGKRLSGDRICRFQHKVIPLGFDVDETILKSLPDSIRKINRLIDDVDLHVLQYNEFGRNFIKERHMSPDAFIQLALQLTYYKVHRKLVSTYESAGLRQFKFGRVDNIRAATDEALNWAKSMCDEGTDTTEQMKVDLFKEAMNKQVEVLKYTISGEGPDNHLLGLREMARLRFGSEEVVALFKEKAYKEYLNFKLSTSQLATESDIIVGYGPVVPDGYGCAYNPKSTSIVFVVSSFFSSPETKSDFFARSLEGTLGQMREICLKL